MKNLMTICAIIILMIFSTLNLKSSANVSVGGADTSRASIIIEAIKLRADTFISMPKAIEIVKERRAKENK